MIPRLLKSHLLKTLKSGKSILLLGPRQAGKSTLIKDLKPRISFNLANQSVFLNFIRDPKYLESKLSALPKEKSEKKRFIFIDEVQRIPSLLNTIQDLVDNQGYQFILSGSSARKLRRGRANLLPGRVISYQLGPIVSAELSYNIDSESALSLGSLPEIITSKDQKISKQILKSYAQIYLNEEIKAEALTKSIESFTRFLYVVAAQSGQFFDLSKISSRAGVPRQTAQRFFELLEDTLIIRRCPAFAKSEKTRLVQHPKAYFFDCGVLNGLLGNFKISDDRREFLFETLFFNQLVTTLEALALDYRLSTFRTSGGAEVDFVLELDDKIFAIECKTGFVRKQELGGFESLQSFLGRRKISHRIVVSDQLESLRLDKILVLPWQVFLKDFIG